MLVTVQEIGPQLQTKVAASDVVQDACLLAHRRFESFQGTTQRELQAWMRTVLLNSLSDSRKKFISKKRDLGREVFGEHDLFVQSPELTPKSAALAAEEHEQLNSALSRLTEDYQQVIRLRNWELLSFTDIGEKMNRSDEAVRKLWSRALKELEKEMRSS